MRIAVWRFGAVWDCGCGIAGWWSFDGIRDRGWYLFKYLALAERSVENVAGGKTEFVFLARFNTQRGGFRRCRLWIEAGVDAKDFVGVQSRKERLGMGSRSSSEGT
jgi:hypothetical protein